MTDMPEVQRFHAWEYTGDHNNGGWSRSKLSHADIELVRAADYDALAAKLAEVTAERDAAMRAVDENWITHQRVVAAETALVAVYRLALEAARRSALSFAYDGDHSVAKAIQALPTPTADALMARIAEETGR